MPYGWTGINLEVDLSRGKLDKVRSDPKLVEDYLGGKGTNAKLLWDRVPPEVAPFSPDNLLIIGTGILTGTMVPSANRTIITFKSPVTDNYLCSVLGGFFGAELKHAGYDTIVISGKSSTPVYLWISDDRVELRDANHLWGKDARETQRLIREGLKVDRAQILSIGQGGENRVYTASIEHSIGASASRGGVGAVMGDKNLKAIAVYGTKDLSVAKPSKLGELCEQILNRTEPLRTQIIEPYGKLLVARHARIGGYGNFGEPVSPELQQKINNVGEMAQDFMERSRTREIGCYNCGLRCRHVCPLPDGGYSFIKCASWSAPMIATKIIDCDFAIGFYNLCEKYGLDCLRTGSCIMFAIDLYERGILTKEDTDGMHLEWENAEVAFSLVEKIVRRDGIGDVLANGVYRAAQQIGRGAEEYAIHTKKQEMIPYSIRGCRSALAEAVNDKADRLSLNNYIGAIMSLRSKEEKEAYIKSGFFPYPKEYEKYFLADIDYTGQNYEPVEQLLSYDEDTYALADMTGLCRYWVLFYWLPPINSRPLIADLVSFATGMDIDETEATRMVKRVANLVRAYSVRAGVRRKDDRIPEMFYKITPSPWSKLDHDLFNKWIDRWYELKGWNSEGFPTKETLEEVGLDYVRQDLERRGILTG